MASARPSKLGVSLPTACAGRPHVSDCDCNPRLATRARPASPDGNARPSEGAAERRPSRARQLRSGPSRRCAQDPLSRQATPQDHPQAVSNGRARRPARLVAAALADTLSFPRSEPRPARRRGRRRIRPRPPAALADFPTATRVGSYAALGGANPRAWRGICSRPAHVISKIHNLLRADDENDFAAPQHRKRSWLPTRIGITSVPSRVIACGGAKGKVGLAPRLCFIPLEPGRES